MTHILIKSDDNFYDVEMNHSQFFEFLLKKGYLKIKTEQGIELSRWLYELMDKLQPTWDLLDELAYKAETEKNEDIRNKLSLEIEAIIENDVVPHEKEANELLQQILAFESEDTESSSI